MPRGSKALTYCSSRGGETTSTTFHWWLLALLAHSEVQVQAHAELDDVIGFARPADLRRSPLCPIYPRDGQRGLALVAFDPLLRTTCLVCR